MGMLRLSTIKPPTAPEIHAASFGIGQGSLQHGSPELWGTTQLHPPLVSSFLLLAGPAQAVSSPRAGDLSSRCALPGARRGGRRRNSSWRRTRGCAPGSSGCRRSGSGETSWKARRWQQLGEPTSSWLLGQSQVWMLLLVGNCYSCSSFGGRSRAAKQGSELTVGAAAPTELPAPPQSRRQPC